MHVRLLETFLSADEGKLIPIAVYTLKNKGGLKVLHNLKRKILVPQRTILSRVL